MEVKLLEKLYQCGRFHEFDYSDPEEADFVLQSLGGEENLRRNYPLVYEAFQASVRNDRDKKRRDGVKEEKVGVSINSMTAETCGSGRKIKVSAVGYFADPDYEAENALRGENPRPWLSGNLFITFFNEKEPVECYYSDSSGFEQIDNFTYEYGTDELTCEAAKECAVTMMVHAVDPNGCMKTYSSSHSSLGRNFNAVDTFSVEDPQSIYGNNPIIMLYGRKRSQNEAFTNADYYNDEAGEYYDNKPQNGNVKTIMPLKGSIQLVPGCSFPEEGVLHKPVKADPPPLNRLIRSNLKIGGIKVATMYGDQSDDEAYETLKKCFSTDMSGAHPTIYFDIKRDDKHDWHSDTTGVGRFTDNAMTYMLNGGFMLDIIDQNGEPMPVQFSITSRELKDMSGKQYCVSNSGQVYVPPVTVHWGCFAKDTPVRLAAGQDKRIDCLERGDQVVTSDGKTVTFLESVTGHEETIFTIIAEDGTIRLTGGHPVLLADGTVKAAGLLKAGEKAAYAIRGKRAVLAVEENEYQDMVYNPIFRESGEDGVFILCGSFYCGDYNAQNRPLRCEKTLTENEKELINQFKNLMISL